MKPIRVVLADDHPIVLRGLAGLLAEDETTKVVAACANGREALDAVAEHDPDIAVLDVRMPQMSGTEALKAIRSLHRRTRVVLLTASVSEAEILAAMAGGASAVVRKDMASDDLVRCLRIVAGGGRWFPRQTGPGESDVEPSPENAATSIASLTPRERDVARLVAAGTSNKGIARQLGVTEGTVKLHLHKIYGKLGVANRTSLAAVALRDRRDPGQDR